MVEACLVSLREVEAQKGLYGRLLNVIIENNQRIENAKQIPEANSCQERKRGCLHSSLQRETGKVES